MLDSVHIFRFPSEFHFHILLVVVTIVIWLDHTVVADILVNLDSNHMDLDILVNLDSNHMDLDIVEHLGLSDMDQLVLFHNQANLDSLHMDRKFGPFPVLS
jgi:hypothetical protein